MRAGVALAAVVSPSLRDLLLLCGWSSGRDMGRCVGDRRQGLCVSRPCSDSRGGRMLWYMVYTLYCLRYTVTTTMLQRDFKQLRELAFTARAVCCCSLDY